MYRYNNADRNQVVDSDKQFVETTLSKVFKFFLSGGIFKIFAYMCILFGGMFWTKEFITSRSYVKTVGTFIDYVGCNDGVCGAQYIYEVNGIEYYVSPNLDSNSFPEEADVYYNPENPGEAMMFSSWHILFITGVVMLVGIELFNKKMKSLIFGGNK